MSFSIKESSEFFVAFSKKKNNNKVMLGITKDNKAKILACISKKKIGNEIGLVFENPDIDGLIKYTAQEISYKTYCKFITFMRQIQIENHASFPCYLPEEMIDKINDQFIIENIEEIIFRDGLGNPIWAFDDMLFDVELEREIHFEKRHLAKQFTEKLSKEKLSIFDESKNILTAKNDKKLAKQIFSYLRNAEGMQSASNRIILSARFKKGNSVDNIYVFPKQAASKKEVINRILEKLYKRLDEILEYEPDSQETYNKFVAVNMLCSDIEALNEQLSDKDNNLKEKLLPTIEAWSEQYGADAFVLRKHYFFDKYIERESDTKKMIHQISKELNRPSLGQ